MPKPESATEDLHPAYWEVNGAAIANGNRAWVLALTSNLITVAAVVFAIAVRLQPPTVIQLRPSGEAIVVGADTKGATKASAMPGEDEGANEQFVTTFLTTYLNYTPTDFEERWRRSLNMMVPDLHEYTKQKLISSKAYEEVKSDQIASVFRLRQLDKVPGERLTYLAYGVKDVYHLVNGVETTDHFVTGYHIQVAAFRHTAENPNGFSITSYSEFPIEGEQRAQIQSAPDTDVSHQ